MTERIIVKGRLVGPTTVELLEPVELTPGDCDVDVVVPAESVGNVSRAKALVEHLLSLPPGSRTREDIDRQIQKERDSWE